MADIKVYNQQGELGTIPEEQVASAVRLGYRVATPEDLAIEKTREEYGGLSGQLGALATGALSGATLGLSDIALKELGAEEALKAYRTLPELQTTRTIAEVGGAIAPALLTGGTGVAARVAAATPAGLAARAGQAASAAVGARLGAAATGISGTAARFAVQGATEAALQGIGQETARLAVDNELSGERIGQIAVAGLTSAAVGAGIGAGLGALGGAVNRAAEAIPPALEGTNLGRRIESALLRGRARIAGLSEADAQYADLLAEPRLRNIALEADNIVDDVIQGAQAGPIGRRVAQVGSLQDDLDRKFAGQQITSQAIRDGHLKIEMVRGNVADDAERMVAQRDFATNELVQALEEVQAARRAGPNQYGQTGLDTLEFELRNAITRADEAIAQGGTRSAEDLYGVLDVQMKRAIGRATARFERLRNPTGPDNRVMQEVLEPMYERIRQGLENPRIWGRVAELQSEMNAPMTRAIRANPAMMAEWYEKTPFGADPTNPWVAGRVASPKKLRANLLNAANPGTDFADRAIREQIANEQAWQRAAVELGNFENLGDLRQAFAEQAALNARILQHLDRSTEAVTAKAFLDQISGSSDSLAGVVAGAAIGSGNPALALFAPLMKPRLVMRGAQVVENIANGQGGRIEQGARRVGRAIRDASVASARRVPVAGAAAARYDERSKRVRDLAAQGDAVRAELAKQTAWMGDRAPVAQQAAIATALRTIEYLNEKMPKGLAAPTPFAPSLPPSRHEMQQWLGRLRAIDNPTSLLDDLAKGKLTPEAVDAVRTVYPETFADIQAKVLDQLTRLEATGRKPEYAKRVELGLLLGIPTDPTMTPEAIASLQGQYQAQPAQTREGQAMPLGQAKGRKAPDFAAAFRSGSAETELTSEAK